MLPPAGNASRWADYARKEKMEPTITILQLMDMLEGTEDTYEKRWKKLREFVDLAKAAQQSVESDGVPPQEPGDVTPPRRS